MCWEGRTKNKKIAKKDIKATKVLYRYEGESNLVSPYMKSEYELGKLYKAQIIGRVGDKCGRKDFSFFVHEGLHCFSKKCIIVSTPNRRELYVRTPSRLERIYIRLGLFAWVFKHSTIREKWDRTNASYEEISFPRDVVLVDVIIPKGTTYYENRNGEIVTEAYQLAETEGIKEEHKNINLFG